MTTQHFSPMTRSKLRTDAVDSGPQRLKSYIWRSETEKPHMQGWYDFIGLFRYDFIGFDNPAREKVKKIIDRLHESCVEACARTVRLRAIRDALKRLYPGEPRGNLPGRLNALSEKGEDQGEGVIEEGDYRS
jgi:hypothetical protein